MYLVSERAFPFSEKKRVLIGKINLKEENKSREIYAVIELKSKISVLVWVRLNSVH